MNYNQQRRLLLEQQRREQQWSARQAQRQMQFQERMSSTAHQREVEDLKKAGLNPVLSAQGAGAATGSGAMAEQSSIIPELAELLRAAGSGGSGGGTKVVINNEEPSTEKAGIEQLDIAKRMNALMETGLNQEEAAASTGQHLKKKNKTNQRNINNEWREGQSLVKEGLSGTRLSFGVSGERKRGSASASGRDIGLVIKGLGMMASAANHKGQQGQKQLARYLYDHPELLRYLNP